MSTATAAVMLTVVFVGCFLGSVMGAAGSEHVKAELLRRRLHRAAEEQVRRVQALTALEQRCAPPEPAPVQRPLPLDVQRWRFMAPGYHDDAPQGVLGEEGSA